MKPASPNRPRELEIPLKPPTPVSSPPTGGMSTTAKITVLSVAIFTSVTFTLLFPPSVVVTLPMISFSAAKLSKVVQERNAQKKQDQAQQNPQVSTPFNVRNDGQRMTVEQRMSARQSVELQRDSKQGEEANTGEEVKLGATIGTVKNDPPEDLFIFEEDPRSGSLSARLLSEQNAFSEKLQTLTSPSDDHDSSSQGGVQSAGSGSNISHETSATTDSRQPFSYADLFPGESAITKLRELTEAPPTFLSENLFVRDRKESDSPNQKFIDVELDNGKSLKVFVMPIRDNQAQLFIPITDQLKSGIKEAESHLKDRSKLMQDAARPEQSRNPVLITLGLLVHENSENLSALDRILSDLTNPPTTDSSAIKNHDAQTSSVVSTGASVARAASALTFLGQIADELISPPSVTENTPIGNLNINSRDGSPPLSIPASEKMLKALVAQLKDSDSVFESITLHPDGTPGGATPDGKPGDAFSSKELLLLARTHLQSLNDQGHDIKSYLKKIESEGASASLSFETTTIKLEGPQNLEIVITPEKMKAIVRVMRLDQNTYNTALQLTGNNATIDGKILTPDEMKIMANKYLQDVYKNNNQDIEKFNSFFEKLK